MEVVLLRWPTEADRREQLRVDGVPRLLLVDADVAAPVPADDFEDWIRVPADARDLHVRVEALQRRALVSYAGRVLPVLDDDGVLWVGGSWVALPPVEVGLMGALVKHYGKVVSRDELTRAGWSDAPPGRNALDVHMLRLRRRGAPLGLVIRTVRSRGYLLELSTSGIDAGRRVTRSAGLLTLDDPLEAPHLQNGDDDQAAEEDL
jgi:two-component system, OmpR family, response regulator